MSGNKIIDVVAAIIIKKDKILLCQRSENAVHALKWEFPGGKIKKGETPEEALSRELYEELRLVVKREKLLLQKSHSYPLEEFSVNIKFYHTEVDNYRFQNRVFEKVGFISANRLEYYDLLDADQNALKEILPVIKTFYS